MKKVCDLSTKNALSGTVLIIIAWKSYASTPHKSNSFKVRLESLALTRGQYSWLFHSSWLASTKRLLLAATLPISTHSPNVTESRKPGETAGIIMKNGTVSRPGWSAFRRDGNKTGVGIDCSTDGEQNPVFV
jgi:hypothetical protein